MPATLPTATPSAPTPKPAYTSGPIGRPCSAAGDDDVDGDAEVDAVADGVAEAGGVASDAAADAGVEASGPAPSASSTVCVSPSLTSTLASARPPLLDVATSWWVPGSTGRGASSDAAGSAAPSIDSDTPSGGAPVILTASTGMRARNAS